jgi:UDP-sugar transporter A1/2/3
MASAQEKATDVNPSMPSKPTSFIENPVVLVVILAVQNAFAVLLMRYVRSTPGQHEFAPVVAVLMQEVVKMLTGLVMVHKQEGIGALNQVGLIQTMNSGVPSMLYFAQNTLQYLAVTRIPAVFYTMAYQSKTVWSAILSTFIFSRSYSEDQWSGVLCLALGIVFVQLSGAKENAYHSITSSASDRWVGLIFILSAAGCSALAGVYFEKMLRGSKVSFWVRNVHLAFFAIVTGVFMMEETIRRNPFTGFTSLTWLCIFSNAYGGILAGMVIKYATALTKDVALGSSVLLSGFMSLFLFDFQVTSLFCFGATVLLTGVGLYGGHLNIGMVGLSCTKEKSSNSEELGLLDERDSTKKENV